MKRMIALLLLAALCLACASCSRREQTASSGSGGIISDSSAPDSGTDTESSSHQSVEPLVFNLDLGELIGAESVDEIFDYGGGILGVIITRTADDEQQRMMINWQKNGLSHVTRELIESIKDV